MGVFRQFPYSNFHEMNMDEIIKIIKNMLEEWANYHAEWDEWMDQMEDDWSNYQDVMNTAWANMQDFINNYFDNLDVQEEINNKIVSMIQTGEFGLLVNEYIPPAVNAWLNANITQPTGVVIDTSLTVAGACADAKATGDAIKVVKNDINDIYDAHFYKKNLTAYDTVTTRGISDSGGVVYDADKTARLYKVEENELLFLDLVGNSGASTAVYVFTTSTSIGSLSADDLVGPVHFGFVINEMIRVPEGATHIAISQPTTNTTFKAQKIIPYEYQKEIDNIRYGAYDSIKGDFELGSILNGVNTTTTTRIRHIKPISYDRDITIFIKNGFKYYIVFYADSEGTTYLETREFVNNDLPITIGANKYFRLVICKNTEETITDMQPYINSLYITTQLFNNPQIYKNPLVKQIAHQGYNLNPADGIGRSLVSSYIGAALVGFTHGETDIQFSSDGIPVCCHDATFTDLNTDTVITISEKTFAELVTYNYYGGTIASFDEVVKTCKQYGLGLYIDHIDFNITDEQLTALFNTVHKYSMERNVVWLITAEQIATRIQALDPNANFSFVITSVSTWEYALETCEAIKTNTNEVSIDIYNNVFLVEDLETYITDLPTGITLEVWVVDSISEWNSYLPYVTGITSNKICANIARTLE